MPNPLSNVQHTQVPFRHLTGAICRDVLDYVSSPYDALTELWRVLKLKTRSANVLGARTVRRNIHGKRFTPETTLRTEWSLFIRGT